MHRVLKAIILAAACVTGVAGTVFAAEIPTYTIKFDNNGGTGTMDDIEAVVNESIALPSNSFSRTNYVFVNWNTGKNAEGTSFRDEASVKDLAEAGKTAVLYAAWAEETASYTVNYDGNGATSGETAASLFSYATGGVFSANGFVREGYTFTGWNTAADGSGSDYHEQSTVIDAIRGAETGAVTVYAQWISNTIKTTDIRVTATWDDENNYDGMRPGSWTANLQSTSGKIYSQKITGDTYLFRNLPLEKDGAQVSYSLSVTDPYGYTSSISPIVNVTEGTILVSFVHDPDTDSYSVDGYFDDNDDADGRRPNNITLKLKGSDGKSYSETIHVGNNSNYSYTFTGLPEYYDGEEIKYSLSVSGASEYKTEISQDGSSFEVTHTYEQETKNVVVQTKWIDNGNENGYRPESFTAVLMGNETTNTETLTSENGYSVTIHDLPIYSDGKKISYKLTATSPEYYEASVAGTINSGFTITQKLIYVGQKETQASAVTESTAADQTASAKNETTKNTNDNNSNTKSETAPEPVKATEPVFVPYYFRIIWDDREAISDRKDVEINLTGSPDGSDVFAIKSTSDRKWIKRDLTEQNTSGEKVTWDVKVGSVDGYTSSVKKTGENNTFITITMTGEKKSDTEYWEAQKNNPESQKIANVNDSQTTAPTRNRDGTITIGRNLTEQKAATDKQSIRMKEDSTEDRFGYEGDTIEYKKPTNNGKDNKLIVKKDSKTDIILISIIGASVLFIGAGVLLFMGRN